MNLPGDTIDVGTTRTPPAPAYAIPSTSVRLDAAFLTDPDAARQMVAHWSREQLYTWGNALRDEADRRIAGQLVDVLRAMFHMGAGELPVVKVEFVTDPNYDDGVYWGDRAVFLHSADGTVAEFEDFTDDAEDEDTPYAALDAAFRDLLADYSRTDRPQHGDHLVVDLASGEFDVSGKWSA